MTDSNAYWQGRRARSAGQPRELRDGRWSAKSRQQWFTGWDDEDHFRAPKLSPDAKAKFLAGLKALRESL